MKNLPIPVLFQNAQCMVFDKPAGLLVIPSPKGETRTLTSLVNDQYAKDKDGWRLHPCHRLDKDTSGCILFAKGKKNQQHLMAEFENRRVHKTYIALAQGRLKNNSGTIKGNVQSREDQKRFGKRSGVFAETHYKLIEQFRDFCVIEVEPATGRTNQIRIHLKQLGHPLIGERIYAFGKDSKLKFRRTALHAAVLEWNDPVEQKKINVRSPLPKDMEEFINKYR